MMLLATHQLCTYYDKFQALFDVDVHIDAGECVALVGANGAGKSTLLKTIAGLLETRSDALRFNDAAIGGRAAHELARRGIALVPEGRRLFRSLSVEENLLIGAQTRRRGAWTLSRVYEMFPNIAERKSHAAGALSGGQQQMVAIGRALMSNPALLLCDEISLGLAPVVVKELYKHLSHIRAAGMSLVVVEQDIAQALQAADRLYCLRGGRVVLEGKTNEVTRGQIAGAYFGVGEHSHGRH